jgi:glucose-6-phosphate dehydrogenase assembly protein OpcA
MHMSAPVATPTKPVDLAEIDRALAELWKHGAKEDETITRAVMSNLVIFAAQPDLAERVPAEIGQIVSQHPARVLLLQTDPHQTNAEVEAHVSAFCQMVGSGRQVCSEYITVEATDRALGRLPYTVRSLLIGDLPTSLWWATTQAPPLAGDVFTQLANMSDQVIYESQAWTDPVEGMIVTADWATGGRHDLAVADLEWRRIKYWKRLISQNLDPAVTPGALSNITEVQVQHGPHALPKAWLLIGWLASRLGWTPQSGKVQLGQDVTCRFRAGDRTVQVVVARKAKAEPYKVHEVSVAWQAGGQNKNMIFSRLAAGMLAVQTDALPPRVLVVPSQPRPGLIARQLPKLGRDAVFLAALAMARGIATALRGS